MVRPKERPAEESDHRADYFLSAYSCNDSRKKSPDRTLPQGLGVILLGSKIYRKRNVRWHV